MSIEKRIERLEQEQGGSVCPICGHSKGERIKEIKFTVLSPGEKEKLGPERCLGCGRLLNFLIGKTKRSGGNNQ